MSVFKNILEPHLEKTCLILYVKNKDTDQPAHLHSLMSIFVIHCLDCMIPTLADGVQANFRVSYPNRVITRVKNA